MSHVNYDRLLFAAYFTPWGKHSSTREQNWGAPLILHGPPGGSKTSRAGKRLAHRVGATFYSMKPGAKGDGGFGVTPVPKQVKFRDGVDADGQAKHKLTTVLSFPVPDWVIELNTKNSALVACDELNTAPPAIQAAMLGLLQEKEIGSGHLGPHVRLIGMTNETEEAAGGWDLAPAIANRLGHLDWPDPDYEELGNFLIGGADIYGADPHFNSRIEENRVLEEWPEAWARAAGATSAFLRARPQLIRNQPKSGDPKASRAWPSPRTWEFATIALASSRVHNLSDEERDLFVESFIGVGAAGEFATWIADQDLPDPVEVLDGKCQFEHNPTRLDRTNAFLNACAALITPPEGNNREKRAKNLWNILNDVCDYDKDLAAPIARIVYLDAKLVDFKEAKEPLTKLKEMLVATERR